MICDQGDNQTSNGNRKTIRRFDHKFITAGIAIGPSPLATSMSLPIKTSVTSKLHLWEMLRENNSEIN